MPGMMYKKGGAVKKGAMKYQEGGLVDRSEAKRRRETAANTVRSVDALPRPRSRMARGLAETALEDAAAETRRLQRDNEERERMGGVSKYQEGGQVRRRRPQPAPRPRAAPPPRSPGMTEDEVLRDQSNRMQGVRDSMMREGDTPYYYGNAGMMDPRNFENANKLREQRRTQPTRMKKGGTVKKKAGGMIAAKSKGKK